MVKVALVTGASSGIGYYAADALCEKGYKVYGMSRHGSDRPGVRYLCGDVTSKDDIRSVVDKVINESGRIDILINDAGFGISGAAEFSSEEDYKRQFDVNFFGAVAMMQEVIPHMRDQKSGNIVNISSVAAVVPIPFQSYYSSVKAALASYSMAVANEVRPFGINICSVFPGDIKTGFTDARKKTATGDDVYGGRISKSVAVMEHDEMTGMSSETAGRFVAKKAIKKKLAPVYTIGFLYKCAVVLARIMPPVILNRLIGKIYGG